MEPRPAEAGCLLLCSGEGWRQGTAAAYEEQSWPSPAPWVELWYFSLITFSEESKPSRKYFFLFGRKPTLPIWISVGQPQQPDLPTQGPGLGLRSGVGNRAAGGGMGKGIWVIIGEGLGKRTEGRMGGMGIGGRGFGELLGKDGGKDWGNYGG